MTDKPKNELAPVEQSTAVQAATKELTASDVWTSLVEMARDDSINPEKLRALTEIQGSVLEQMNKEREREAKARFDRAFAQACREMPIITKDEKIEHNGKFIGWFKKYEDLRAVVDKIIQPLGLTVSHDCSEIDGGKGGVLVWTVITYMDAEHTWSETRAKMPVPPDVGGAKGAAQAVGSSMTYGERYSLVGTFGIVQMGLDRDGSTRAPRLAMPVDEQKLWDDGMNAATGGLNKYQVWFKSLTNVQRGWLVDAGKHDGLKQSAAKHDE